VLCYAISAGRHDNCRGRGHVKGSGPIATCAASIDHHADSIRSDWNCPIAHYRCKTDDFVQALPLHSERCHQRRELGGRYFFVHDCGHGKARLFLGQVMARDNT
jgi:hypothetical protein